MTKVCLFTASASRELEGILDYVASYGSLDASDRLLGRINATCQKIANFPGMGKSRMEFPHGVRSFPVRDYLICYRETDIGIEILRIVSGYRDLESLFVEE
ncbi:type II toxin-antitoxin system RelE/ParE family toxin [Chamaesiphon sp. VAR_48_metabat_135_sub]|uniref:type II toxin-antitoxin system RelE/ParE family toxin n=1 Tax=Chamaesiphon sp. VAR_48_metabat_135_sub TaxID=2964699 RepID=UPI00286A1180|nr:type II toxin-antitoxin system RelE/ParE family toxin [Chamaesiphon sp. VAR_48_metabat_135_sub]